MYKDEVYALANLGVHPLLEKVDNKLLKPLLERFDEEIMKRYSLETDELHHHLKIELIHFFEKVIAEEVQNLRSLRKKHQHFINDYSNVEQNHDKQRLILNYAKEMGATDVELKNDEKAFSRWFDVGAMYDRFSRRVSFSERKMTLCLQRLGPLIAHVLGSEATKTKRRQLWLQLNLEKSITPIFDLNADIRVITAAFCSLVQSLQGLPKSEQKEVIGNTTLDYIYHSALEKNKNTWLQSEAFNLLLTFSFESLLVALKKCFTEIEQHDDIFLRRRAVLLITNHLSEYPVLGDFLSIVVKDPSPYVRQGLASQLDKLTNESFINLISVIALQDTSPQVRASSLLCLSHTLNNEVLFLVIIDIFRSVFENEEDEFVVRVALKATVDGYQELSKSSPDLADKWISELTPLLETLCTHAKKLTIRRWASEAYELLWCESTSEAKTIKEKLIEITELLHQGTTIKFPKNILQQHDENVIGRVMAVMAQRDFELVIYSGWRGPAITRGYCFGFRFWRLLHELRNPSPDKRQGFRHTIGRISKGHLKAPSGILAEMSETKVPGEPLYMANEGGARNYLPIMDDLFTCLHHPRTTIKLFTCKGITLLSAPKNLLERLKARWWLTLNVTRYADLRNWQESDQYNPNAYLSALCQLGFNVGFQPYSHQLLDPAVARFFL